MPQLRQVDPRGQRHAISAQGLLMGNRGDLRGGDGALTRSWAHKSWVTCLLAMPEGRAPASPTRPLRYTKLFFLDEATAFSAGHRPCAYCQRSRFDAFKAAWCATEGLPGSTSIAAIDSQLHAERLAGGREKNVYEDIVAALPLGAMFEHAGQPVLLWRQGLFRWSFQGYAPHPEIAADVRVRVLTPASVIRLFAAGWLPDVHPSASLVGKK